MTNIGSVQTIFLLLLTFVVSFALLARLLRLPYPIVLVVAGLVLGVTPGVPRIELAPDIVFLVVLPPLLFSSAWMTSWREFRFHLVSIAMLAFGLVGFTVAAIAFVSPRVFPGFDWQTGFVLGAVVATTDAIAATSVATRVGLPRRIVDILEGESLLNDATGLLALEFAFAILLRHQTPTVAFGAGRLLWLTFGGVAVGLLTGFLVDLLERRIDDAPIEVVLSILVSYGSYLAADEMHASGVLAVVTCGLYLSRRSVRFFSPAVRLQITAVWTSLTFALNGLVFVLIGLQLPVVRAGIKGFSLPALLLYGGGFSLLLILVRLAWVFPGAYLAFFLRRYLLHQDNPLPSVKEIFVVGWTGMRGVLALAAALSIPTKSLDGAPVPQRDLIVFLAFSVIFVTLVLQGLTLPWLIRLLGLGQSSRMNREEQEARSTILRRALDHLESARSDADPEFMELYDDIREHYRRRLAHWESPAGEDTHSEPLLRYRQLTRELLTIERDTAVELRNSGRISDDVLRVLQREVDLAEERLTTTESR